VTIESLIGTTAGIVVGSLWRAWSDHRRARRPARDPSRTWAFAAGHRLAAPVHRLAATLHRLRRRLQHQRAQRHRDRAGARHCVAQ
jgi:hypothetical protein